MSKNPDNLEVLTPSIKFSQTKESRFANLAAQATALSDIFLKKRERLDSVDFTENILSRNRGISDALLPDYKIVLDGHYDRKRRRSSVLMMKELPHLTVDELNPEPEVLDPITEEIRDDERPESRKRKDNDGFDFLMPKNKRKNDTKFVIKIDKGKEDLKLNADSNTRHKKMNAEGEQQYMDTFIQTNEIPIVNDNENKPLGFVDEKQRLKTKIGKVNIYWDKKSLYIPNVFRLARLIDDDSKNLMEFQDYSKKSVLVQGNGQSHKKSSASIVSEHDNNDLNDDGVTFIQRRSFNMVFDHPDDIFAFLH